MKGLMLQGQRVRALIRLAFKVGSAASCLGPVLGLAVFWWLPFRPAVTVYVLINGLAFMLLKWIELARLSVDLEEIVGRKVGDH